MPGVRTASEGNKWTVKAEPLSRTVIAQAELTGRRGPIASEAGWLWEGQVDEPEVEGPCPPEP